MHSNCATQDTYTKYELIVLRPTTERRATEYVWELSAQNWIKYVMAHFMLNENMFLTANSIKSIELMVDVIMCCTIH